MKRLSKKQLRKYRKLFIDGSIVNIVLSIVIIIVSILTFKLVAEQTRYARIQSASERTKQAQAIRKALEYCDENPESTESGLQNTDTGEDAPCSEILRLK